MGILSAKNLGSLICVIIFSSVLSPNCLNAENRGITINVENNAVSTIEYDPSNNYALIIGIDKYKSWPKLASAVNDARSIASILTDEYLFAPEKIFEFYDSDATKDNILKKLRELRNLSDQSNLVIYYAGHGWLDASSDEGYWITVETKLDSPWGGISVNELMNGYLKPLKVKHLTMFVDACFGGALLKTRGIEESPFHARKFARKSRMALTSGNIETVPDEAAEGHSLFNLKLQQYLKGTLPGAQREFFTLSDIYTGIGAEIARFSVTNQEPVLARLNDPVDEKGEFVFYRKPNGRVYLPVGADLEQVGPGFSGHYNLKARKLFIRSQGDIVRELPKNDVTPKFVREIQSTEEVLGVGFGAYADRLLLVNGKRFEVRDLSGETLFFTHEFSSGVSSLHLHPESGRVLVAGRDKTINVFRIEEQAVAFERQLRSRGKGPQVLTLSKKGQIAAGYSGGEIEILDLNQGTTTNFFEGHRKAIRGLYYNEQGTVLISVGGDSLTRFWDAQTFSEKKSFKESGDEISQVVVAPEFNLMAISAKQIKIDLMRNRREDSRFIIVRSFESGEELTRIDLDKDIIQLAFFKNPRYISAITADQRIHIFDIGLGKEIFNQQIYYLAKGIEFDRSGKYMVIMDKRRYAIFEL